MNEGWICPVCRRGVAPTEKSCGHGNIFANFPIPVLVPMNDGMCDACRATGICGCYRPERGPFFTISGGN